MNKINCPNCGAPIDGFLNKCPYCGTFYYDFSEIDISSREPIFLKIRYGDNVFIQKVFCTGCDVTYHPIYHGIYADNQLIMCQKNEEVDINVSFSGC